MKVLVTGGTGFTGSHLVRRLLQDGHNVHVLDYNKGLFFDELQNLGAKIQFGSVANAAVCRKALDDAQPEVVYHLAAAFREINVPKSHYWSVNVGGTRHLVEAAQKDGVRKFVYCSTQGVHGDIKNPPGNEDSPIAPEDYYQHTKHEGEKVVNEVVAKTGFDAMIVRPTAIYGPGDPARFLMLFKRCKTGSFPMFGDGQCTYHPVYIDNLVDCFLLAAEKGRKGEVYLGADAHYYTIEELVKRVGRAVGTGVDVGLRVGAGVLVGVGVALGAGAAVATGAEVLFGRSVAATVGVGIGVDTGGSGVSVGSTSGTTTGAEVGVRD